MAIYDKGFVDRVAKKMSNKVISVTEQNIHSDGLMTLTADVQRNDNDVTEIGTRLNAESMNKAVLDLVYNELYGIQVNKDLHSLELVADGKDTFKITCNERPLFANCICDGGIEFTGENIVYEGGAEITLEIQASSSLLDSDATKEIDFKIELYTDSLGKNYLVTLTGYVKYKPTSTSSTD